MEDCAATSDGPWEDASPPVWLSDAVATSASGRRWWHAQLKRSITYHRSLPSVPRASHRTVAKYVSRGWARGLWRASPTVTSSVISGNSPHLTSFYRLLPCPCCCPHLRFGPQCTAVRGVRLRESRPNKEHPKVRAANEADANGYADLRPAVVAAAVVSPPTTAGVM